MKGFIRKSGLTKNEALIVAFLVIAFITGLIIKYSGWKKPQEYDYSASDKKFDEQVRSAFGELEKNKLTDNGQQRKNELDRFADSLITAKENTPRNDTSKIDRKININSAFAPDLEILPGIGEVIAERIVDYREQKGGFKKIEDIKKVKGIGEKKFEQIREYITVE